MAVTNILAAVAVGDIERAEAFYADLFGAAPDARPMDGLIEWHRAGVTLQLVLDGERAGGSLVTLFVDQLEDADGTVTSGNKVRTVTDPDGNGITLLAEG